MKLLGSIIYVTSSFCRFGSLLSTLDSLLLCLYHTLRSIVFQDGMFHKKYTKKLEKVSIDKSVSRMI